LDEGELVEAQNVLKMGYDLFRRSGNILGIGFALSKMGLAADAEKDYARARRYYEEGLEIFNRFEDQAGLAYTNSRLSQTAYAEGHYNEAVHYGQLGLAQFEKIGHKWGVGACLCRLGFAYIELNELEKAEDCFHKALELATSMQHIPLSLYALAGIANLLAVTGEEVRAVELSAFVLSRHDATGYRDLAGRRLPGLEASLGADVYSAAFERGQAMQLDEMVRLHRGA
jgi:tetratricopeptide (TPR) repeat protein